MDRNNNQHIITKEMIEKYTLYLWEQEKSPATVQKYIRDLHTVCWYLDGTPVTKLLLLSWKQKLTESYAPASVNTMLAALNGLLEYLGWNDLKIKPLKIQRDLFCTEEKELTKAEYLRLVQAAKHRKNECLFLILQAIFAT